MSYFAIMVLLLLLVVMAAWSAIMTNLLLRAALFLALTSALLSMLMFQMGAPLAAVFELTVCGGLILVLFVSVIAMTKRLQEEEKAAHRNARIERFKYLPIVLILGGIAVWFMYIPLDFPAPGFEAIPDPRTILWHLRRLDLFGQIVALIAGVFGVLVLFKGDKNGGN